MGHSYRDLLVWQKAVGMVTEVYRITQSFPKEEMFGLTRQVRRSAVSVPSNIAEGQGRLSRKDFRHFLGQARGSLLEMETQLLIASNLGYISEQQLAEIFDTSGSVSRMLHRLVESVSDEPSSGRSRN